MSQLKSCHCCGLIQQSPSGVATVCCRCETRLESWWHRFTGNQLAAAFALTGLILYLPAMLLPFLRIEQLGQAHESSLIFGVRTLFAEGQWFVGLVVLLFSVVLPVMKLTVLLFLSQRRWQMADRHRARTYRVIEQLGRWGMLDVLLVAVMIAFIKLGDLVAFEAAPGLMVFTLFVLLSLLASSFFNPHCLWDEGPAFSGGGTLGTILASADEGSDNAESKTLPTAKVNSANTSISGLILMCVGPLLALVFVVWVSWIAISQRGHEITISFKDGRGIEVGDELRYHGIMAGKVEAVHLSNELQGVVVHLRLTQSAEHLACDGSRFWIVRPQAGITGVSGLETVIGSKYIAVQPGNVDATSQVDFVGLEQPPLPDLEYAGGLEIVLESPQATGLRSGLGVSYRNVRIGGIVETGLAADGSAVETRVYVRPQYRHLICEHTKFWNAGGVRLTGGLTEISVYIGTLETIVHGGIAIAVPPDAGAEVAEGTRFDLHDQPQASWRAWQPHLENRQLSIPAQLPKLLNATLTWKQDGYFRNPTRRNNGWVLPTPEGLLGPRDLLCIPADAVKGSARLQLPGRVMTLDDKFQVISEEVVIRHDDAQQKGAVVNRRMMSTPEDGFLITESKDFPLLFAAARYEAGRDGRWPVDASLSVSKSQHGGMIVAISDGAVIGCLVYVDGQPIVFPVAN